MPFAKILAFLLDHIDLIEIIHDAIETKGADKRVIVEAIKKGITASYDARAQAEFT
jgi:hypothetical protein